MLPFSLIIKIHFISFTVKNTVISPNFLARKFWGKVQFPHSFHTRKLSKIKVFYAAFVVVELCEQMRTCFYIWFFYTSFFDVLHILTLSVYFTAFESLVCFVYIWQCLRHTHFEHNKLFNKHSEIFDTKASRYDVNTLRLFHKKV